MRINTHVSDKSAALDCHTAYKYITSLGSSKTKKCMRAYTTKRRSSASASEVLLKVKRLTPYDIIRFIRNNNVKTEGDLLKKNLEREATGQFDLAKFVINVKRISKARVNLVKIAWKLENARASIER